MISGRQGRHYPSSAQFFLQSACRRSILTAKGQNWPEVRSIHIMRTKCITICFQNWRLVGFLITNGDIMARRPQMADCLAGAWWSDGEARTVPRRTPHPRGSRKNRGRLPGRYRLYSTAIQNHLLKTGGTGKTGGHDF